MMISFRDPAGSTKDTDHMVALDNMGVAIGGVSFGLDTPVGRLVHHERHDRDRRPVHEPRSRQLDADLVDRAAVPLIEYVPGDGKCARDRESQGLRP
jgi:hypothetical protein